MNLLERIYLYEIGRGLSITIKHFLRNIVRPSRMPTIQYPEEKKPFPPRARLQHRFVLRDDGSVRCVACRLCATICPTKCITISAEEHPDPAIEKYPATYTIDPFRCIYCGLCVEVCPVDAIRMDSGKNYPVVYSKKDIVFDIKYLSENQPSSFRPR